MGFHRLFSENKNNAETVLGWGKGPGPVVVRFDLDAYILAISQHC